MTQFYSNSLGKFLFYLILLFLSACAQQPGKIVPGDESGSELSAKRESPSLLERIFSIDTDSDDVDFDVEAVNAAGPDQYNNLWARLFSLYALPDIDNPRIEYELQRYIKNPGYLEKIQERAEPYLYAIVEEIDAKNMPGELALLPVVESAFKPHAYSRSKAAGLWQFIPATGRFFGLKQNWWYDARRDIYSSTRVATNYLKELHDLFDDDWLLALASYNAGKGTVGKSIARNKRHNKPTDYWSLSLSRETMAYVPRLLAIAKIFANAEKYNITLRPIANKRVFELVDIKGQIDLAKAAKMADMSIQEIRKFNPGFHRWSTDPDGPHRLLIPVDKVALFKQNMAKVPTDEWVTWQRHKVKSGESLSVIARKYQTTVRGVRQVNKLPNNTIHAGRYLLIPVAQQRVPYSPKITAQSYADNKQLVYTVRPGDSYWRIGQKHDVSSKQIASWNNITLNKVLRPGQKLIIRNGNISAQKISGSAKLIGPLHYTVQKGDSLSRISRKFNVSIANLRKWNAKTLGKHLHPGQKLIVKASIDQPAT